MQFLNKMSPSEQITAGRYPDRAYFGKAPTLAIINKTYGEGTAATWLIAQIHDLCEFTNSRGKLDERQMTMLAEIIANEYAFLKSSELLLFFYNFKAGKYGRFYGTVDPLIIEEALAEFMAERQHQIDLKESEEKKREEAEHQRQVVPTSVIAKRLGLPEDASVFEIFDYKARLDIFVDQILSLCNWFGVVGNALNDTPKLEKS